MSNPTHAGFAPPPEVLRALASPSAAVYEPLPLGLPSARQAVSTYYATRGRAIAADRIALTASTSEAYHALFTLLCDPGDAVLVPQPSYPLFSLLADIASVRLVPYSLRYDGEWHIDFSTLRDDAKAIIVVSPNNPTGHYTTGEEYERLAARGLPLIVDEVFHDFPLKGRPPPFRDTGALTFTLSGLSKVALLPQVKLGWCAVNGPGADEALARLEVILDTFLSVSGPVQHALPALLAYGEDVRPRVRARLAANLQALTRKLSGSAATVLRCDAGFCAIVRLPAVCDEDEWCQTFAAQKLVVQPGYFYDLRNGPHVVVSLLTPEDTFSEALQRWHLRQ